ncbi:hypothetical protein SSCG_01779 [Streptomyces clavuligerus]|nr:hypothetical protein SSCG_01779 [Streptomyces clavuligerus]
MAGPCGSSRCGLCPQEAGRRPGDGPSPDPVISRDGEARSFVCALFAPCRAGFRSA